jgi:adenylate cyclase
VNSRKQLVAYPDIEQVVKRDEAGKPVIGMIDDVNDKNVRAAIREFWSTRKSDIEVEVDGRLMIGTFSRMPAIVGKKWIIGIVVPADDFLGPVKETSRTALMISAGLLLAGVIAIGLVSKTVSRPVRQLAGETRKIRDFDLDDDIDVRSRIAEPYELANSLATMKTAIRSFSKFAPRALVRQLIESGEGVELGGHKHDLTVMFTDIQGFTGISENMDPEEVMLHVSEYFEELTDIIRSNRGTIDKFIGDSIMAFWGAPVNDDEHPFKAVRAALQCDKRLEHLNEKWAANDKPPMITRFGLHSGEMIVGNFGSLERLNYTVLGDAVNLASRLEGINKVYGTRICISDDLYHRIRERYLTRPLDIVAVEGRQQGTIIHELCASRFDDPEIGATDKQIELCAKTAAGFDFYVNRQWDEAIRIYESIANNFPKDRVTQIFIMRCQGYRENPPGDSWPEIP